MGFIRMKSIFTSILSLLAAVTIAQTSAKSDTVKFCYIKYALPAGCSATSESQVKCDDYSMSWIYLSYSQLQSVPGQTIDNLSHQLKKFKKEAIACYLLDAPVKGYKINYKTDQGTVYQLMAYGVANEQPVILQLILNKEPKSNDDIPAFARQIIRFSN
jgi:hypothetical protein